MNMSGKSQPPMRLRVADLARAAGISAQQVRNYVETGLLPPVALVRIVVDPSTIFRTKAMTLGHRQIERRVELPHRLGIAADPVRMQQQREPPTGGAQLLGCGARGHAEHGERIHPGRER